MTLNELKQTPNLQEKLQAVIKEIYNVSYPVSDLVRRAALKPELLHLDQLEKPLYAVCAMVKETWVKDILDEIEKDYSTNPNVQRYIVGYFKQQGVVDKEELKVKMQRCIETLPNHLKDEPTCNNFKICKYIELAQRDEGKFADVTDALMGNKEAVVDYGASLEDLIEEGTPIDVANNMATDKTSKRYKFVEVMAAPVRMKYQIRDSLEQSIAAGLGEYGDEYLANKKEIRERKAEMKREREEAKHQAEMDRVRTGDTSNKHRNQSQYGNSYGNSMYGNSYGNSMYGNQRGGLFGRRNRMGYGNSMGYGGMGSGYGRRGSLYLSLISTGLIILFGLITFISCLIMKRGLLNIGTIVWIVSSVLNLVGFIKKGMRENGWQVIHIVAVLISIVGMVLLFKF